MMNLLFKQTRLALLVMVAGLFLWSSCDFEDPEFSEYSNFKLVKMDGRRLDILFDVTCENPNNFGFKVKNGAIDVLLNDQALGVINLSQKIKVKRKSKNVYTVPLGIDLENGAMIKLLQLAGTKEVTLKLVGKVRGSVYGISKSFDVNETRKVDGAMLKMGLGKITGN